MAMEWLDGDHPGPRGRQRVSGCSNTDVVRNFEGAHWILH